MDKKQQLLNTILNGKSLLNDWKFMETASMFP